MKIRAATRADANSITKLLAESFSEDPVLLEYIGRSGDPRVKLAHIFQAELESFYLPRGCVDVAVEGDEIIGAALWAPPGTQPGTLSKLRVGAATWRALRWRFPRALALQRAWHKATPTFSHWYLYTLAADQKARGKGVGSALLSSGLRRADGDPVYLEATSEPATLLYEKNGFVRLGRIPTSLRAAEIGMWKPGRAPF